MELLKKMLKSREENQANILAKRLDRLWVKRQKEKDAKVKKLRSENIKAIRKLIKKRENAHNEYRAKNIIEEYAKYETEVYAPLTRHGYFPDKNAENYQVKNKYLDTYHGLLELEASLPSYTNIDIDVLDTNDNVPEISVSFLNTLKKERVSNDNDNNDNDVKYNVYVPEHTKTNKFIAHVSIVDKDTNDNGKVDWMILINEKVFESKFFCYFIWMKLYSYVGGFVTRFHKKSYF